MQQQPDWVPGGINMDVASPARMYDALLGGSHNFAVDRAAAAQATALVPDLPEVARTNRAFLHRAVRFLSGEGIGQFVDLGAGIPTVGSSHEVARAAEPAARVAYVDIDPVAVAHAKSILGDDPRTAVVQGDLRTPRELMDAVVDSGLIDLDRPVGVLLVAVLHLLTDADRPYEVVATLRDLVPPGSYLVISHLSRSGRPEDAARLGAHSAQRTRVPIVFRSEEEIAGFFAGLTLVPPGLVELPLWRPEPDAELDVTDQGAAGGSRRSLGLAGVGRRD